MVAAVVDGTASIAGQGLVVTSFGALIARLVGPGLLAALQAGVERDLHPLLWDPLLRQLLALPAAALFTAFGILFWTASRERPERIGFSPRD